jgi:hypothetical protein
MKKGIAGRFNALKAERDDGALVATFRDAGLSPITWTCCWRASSAPNPPRRGGLARERVLRVNDSAQASVDEASDGRMDHWSHGAFVLVPVVLTSVIGMKIAHHGNPLAVSLAAMTGAMPLMCNVTPRTGQPRRSQARWQRCARDLFRQPRS